MEGLRKLEELCDGKCSMVCNVAYYDGHTLELAEGSLEGRMNYEDANPYSKSSLMTAFVPEGHNKPLKDLDINNHRQVAFEKLKNKL